MSINLYGKSTELEKALKDYGTSAIFGTEGTHDQNEERQARILALLQDTTRLSQLPSHSHGATTSAPPAVRGDTQMYVGTVLTSTTGKSHSDTSIVRDATETALPTDASDLSTPD
nr:hypothetical protein [Tanacetum cinerariifolium]